VAVSPQPLAAHYPVVIVGGGSVGLSLAAELGWRGIECLLVEEREGLNDHPRANAVANRTMEYYRRWGIDEAITSAGIPPDMPAEYLWVSSLHGREIHRVSLPPFSKLVASHDASGYATNEHQWSPYLKTITGQNEVEAVLLDYVDSRTSVERRFGCRLVDFVDDADGLRCRVEDCASGRVQTVAADYLAACDGGRSSVRQQLGIDYAGSAALASFVSIYFRAPDMIKHHAFGHGNIYFPIHRDYRGFILTWDDDQTYTYHLVLDKGRTASDIDPRQAITRVVGAAFDIEVLSVQQWTAHALVAEEYHKGRVVLVGDAAHLFSPTGGFGMNTGVSDAIDVAWKIQATLAGWGGPRLLSSYERERRPVGQRNTLEAADCFERLFALMGHGDELDADNAAGDALRERLRAELKAQEKLVSSSGTLLGYRYEGSDIIVADGSAEPADDARRYVPVARPGHRAPHVWLEDGVALYDRLGAGFTLLQLSAVPQDVTAFVDYAADIGLPLHVAHIATPAVREIYASDMVLIRPDLMVAWRWDGGLIEARTVLDCVRGA
jgi:2-polyprenyl-6-methoxyphenol hydroxylase-like FAD-dependent oxidoreductase